jgi:2-polyprenyl-6-methoxyphenol hydroxylase-like FAD-dependent oxidoreductase
MDRKRILVSGGGIAGLTFAIELKRRGFDPLVIERETGLRTEGYMMDFFGSGWDVASRMGLTNALRAVHYPIESVAFVNLSGAVYARFPVDRVRAALGGNYVYLRRPDLERILADRARETGVEIRYGTSLAAIEDRGDVILARFEDGSEERFALAVGADGVHSRLRELVFGAERQFARFLGLYVAAFHLPHGNFRIGREVRLYEETDHSVFLYPLSGTQLDATISFRHAETAIPHDGRIDFLRKQLGGAGWIIPDILNAYDGTDPVYLDDATQIVMPQWHKGRVALIGDACGCLTLLAGQGSHMAMAGAYLLAEALARHDDHRSAFAEYQNFLKPHVDKKQRDAARFVTLFLPTKNSREWVRRLFIRLFFSRMLIGLAFRYFGATSVLPPRRQPPE